MYSLTPVTFDKTGRLFVPARLHHVSKHSTITITLMASEKCLHFSFNTIPPEGVFYKKKVDPDGRVLLPASFRHSLQWEEETLLEWDESEGDLYLKTYTASCALCRKKEELLPAGQSYLCLDCREESSHAETNRWKSTLDQLFSDHFTYCRKALTLEDTEDVHQARVTGRRLQALIDFLGIPRSHDVRTRLKRIHRLLAPLRESDVIISSFQSLLDQTTDPRQEEVFKTVLRLQYLKQKKHQQALLTKLPEMIKDAHMKQWHFFLESELPLFSRFFPLKDRLEKKESTYRKTFRRYESIKDRHGWTHARTLAALHDVRLQTKEMRYLYKYTSSIYQFDGNRSEELYKQMQPLLGDINDRRDWLREIHKKKVKTRLSQNGVQILSRIFNEEIYRLHKELVRL
ncbi:CHAD domain-containing protein [Marinococcus luteus]|uniref:CHAD domain-containing protein n=1 Tax=Marinococcus luteus TaxID=1122204 RepID=A0A1H2WVY2_9BACI|nr:CHAD domain-containing protein [Marinococcus luteus]SDW84725.1 CHAD domain-containing protein [Marinococcus luteus]